MLQLEILGERRRKVGLRRVVDDVQDGDELVIRLALVGLLRPVALVRHPPRLELTVLPSTSVDGRVAIREGVGLEERLVHLLDVQEHALVVAIELEAYELGSRRGDTHRGEQVERHLLRQHRGVRVLRHQVERGAPLEPDVLLEAHVPALLGKGARGRATQPHLDRIGRPLGHEDGILLRRPRVRREQPHRGLGDDELVFRDARLHGRQLEAAADFQLLRRRVHRRRRRRGRRWHRRRWRRRWLHGRWGRVLRAGRRRRDGRGRSSRVASPHPHHHWKTEQES